MGATSILHSYGLFETEGVAVTEQSLGKWIIKINDVDITGTQKDIDVDNFYYEDSNVVEGNKIAPGRKGYVDLILDPSETDVSVLYKIAFDFSKLENQAITASIEDMTGGNIIRTGENEYTGVIKLEDIKKGVTNTIRVNVIWENKEENNEVDSEIGQTVDATIKIPVSINVSQYTQEEIVPYPAG